MNCPQCGAPMKLEAGAESMTCAYCHSVYFPEKNDEDVRVLGTPGKELCPVCGVGLVDAAFLSARMEYCTRCRGMLIPMETFAALVGELRQGHEGGVRQMAPDRSELERRLTCPRCHQGMDTHFYAGPGNVILSACEHCSLDWMNHAKLMQIGHAPDALGEDG